MVGARRDPDTLDGRNLPLTGPAAHQSPLTCAPRGSREWTVWDPKHELQDKTHLRANPYSAPGKQSPSSLEPQLFHLYNGDDSM